MQTIIYKVHVV